MAAKSLLFVTICEVVNGVGECGGVAFGVQKPFRGNVGVEWITDAKAKQPTAVKPFPAVVEANVQMSQILNDCGHSVPLSKLLKEFRQPLS